jgi:sulfide:quinone oxidoreductase
MPLAVAHDGGNGAVAASDGWSDRMTRIVILGAGFGGLELASRLSAGLGDEVDIALIDQSDGFVFGFAKLDVMFGRGPASAVRHYYRDLVQPGVRFVPSTVRSIDPVAKRVVTDAGAFDADFLVVALGADLHPAATPGLVECGYEFYTEPGAFALRDVLDRFEGGRVIVAVTSTPFKCPPAPSETALLMHDHLSARGLLDRSDISLVMPLGSPIPPSPAASDAVLRRFAEIGVAWHPNRVVRALDPARRVALFADGDEMPFDLFLGVPVHRVPAVVEESGLAVDGWIPVDSLTLETRYPGVFAVGDVTSVGTPKAGVFAEGQAAVVADRIIATLRGDEVSAQYGGNGMCYLEFGTGRVARVDVTFVSGQPPSGRFDEPSLALAADKAEFGTSRIRRWFGDST